MESTLAPDANTEQLVINHAPQRKVLTYRFEGRNQQLELISVRDYTIEQAVNLHLQSIRNEVEANKILTRAEKSARRDNINQIIEMIRLAVFYDPNISEDLAKNRDFKRLYEKDDKWQALLAEAEEAKIAHEANLEAIVTKAQELREQRQELLQ